MKRIKYFQTHLRGHFPDTKARWERKVRYDKKRKWQAYRPDKGGFKNPEQYTTKLNLTAH